MDSESGMTIVPNDTSKKDSETIDSCNPQKDTSEPKDPYPDYPQKHEFSSTDDYEKAVKAFCNEKGLKYIDEFSEDEKNAIFEDCVVILIGPKALAQKHNTMFYTINR